MILEIDDLVGGYSRVPVLKKVSFKVEEGQLVDWPLAPVLRHD